MLTPNDGEPFRAHQFLEIGIGKTLMVDLGRKRRAQLSTYPRPKTLSRASRLFTRPILKGSRKAKFEPRGRPGATWAWKASPAGSRAEASA